jgi:fumarate reductase flavoprotein subunit
VTRADGSPVPNLYAAGEVLGMGQVNGKSMPGGTAVMTALAFGRLLGREFISPGTVQR